MGKRKTDQQDSESDDNAASAALTKKQKKRAREERRSKKLAVGEVVKPEGEGEGEGDTKEYVQEDMKEKKEEKNDRGGAPDSKGGPAIEKKAEEHSKKLAKMLPTRAEKARRDQQKKIQAFVLDLKAKGITDAKQVKKEKLKYKKLLEKRAGHKRPMKH